MTEIKYASLVPWNAIPCHAHDEDNDAQDRHHFYLARMFWDVVLLWRDLLEAIDQSWPLLHSPELPNTLKPRTLQRTFMTGGLVRGKSKTS